MIDNFDFNFTVLVNNPNKTDLNKWLIEIDLRLIKFKPSNQALINVKINELFFEYKKAINVANIKNEIKQLRNYFIIYVIKKKRHKE